MMHFRIGRSDDRQTLARELRAIGMPEHEISELTRAAGRLSTLRVPGMSQAARQRVAGRLPIDVEAHAEPPRRLPTVRWALAGSFTVLALVIGVTWAALPGTPMYQPSDDTGKARQDVHPEQTEQLLEQRAAEIQQLQEQPTIDEKALQKAKDDFRRNYERYERLHSKDKSSKDPWSDYQSQWWWSGMRPNEQDRYNR